MAIFETIGSLIGGVMNNDAARDRQNEANAFSSSQFAHRYQTTVKDMQAAGLNPMLAYQQGGGSPPTAQAAPTQDVITPAIHSFQSASAGKQALAQAGLTQAQTGLVDAQKENIEADTRVKLANAPLAAAQENLATASADQARTNTGYLEMQSKRIAEEIKNIPKEGNRLDALVRNLGAEFANIRARTATEEQARVQMQMLARRTMLEGDLTGMDVEAAQNLDNMGRQARELKPIVDILRGLFPSKR